jgi:hypothetical protein
MYRKREMTWQPIETAPKGSHDVDFLVGAFGSIHVYTLVRWDAFGKFYEDYEIEYTAEDLAKRYTHWMPLPEPPKE